MIFNNLGDDKEQEIIKITTFDVILCVLFFVLSVLIHLLAESVLLFCCEYFCIVDTHRETYARVLNMSEKSGVLVLDKNTLMPQYVN